MDSLNSVVRALTLGKALGLAGESLLLFIEHIEPLCEMDILKEENEAERQFEEYCREAEKKLGVERNPDDRFVVCDENAPQEYYPYELEQMECSMMMSELYLADFSFNDENDLVVAEIVSLSSDAMFQHGVDKLIPCSNARCKGPTPGVTRHVDMRNCDESVLGRNSVKLIRIYGTVT